MWGTVQYPDLDRDGKDDTCFRTWAGIRCGLSSGRSFGPLDRWSAGFQDEYDGNHPTVWPTVQLFDVTGDGLPDLCARGFFQLVCIFQLSQRDPQNGERFGGVVVVDEFGNQQGFDQGFSNYGSIQPADINGDGQMDVCGKAPDALWCVPLTGFVGSDQARRWSDAMSDERGWSAPVHALSIQFADLDRDGREDVCGRNRDGLHCGISNGSDGFLPLTPVPGFSDSDGFLPLSAASTAWLGHFVTGDCRSPSRLRRLRRPLLLALSSGELSPPPSTSATPSALKPPVR